MSTRGRSRNGPLLRYLALPAKLENGQYDALGNKVPAGQEDQVRLVLHELPGNPSPWQCWGVVEGRLQPGQDAQVIFFNVEGSAVPGGAFTEWNRKTATPTFSESLLSLQSVSRGVGRARIVGRNDSSKAVRAAAGLLFVPPLKPKHDGKAQTVTAPAQAEKKAVAPKEAEPPKKPATRKAPAKAKTSAPKKAAARKTAPKTPVAKKTAPRKTSTSSTGKEA